MKCFSDTKHGDLTGRDVKGSFWLFEGDIESLKGCPRTFTGFFGMSCNKLRNLNHAPVEIFGHTTFAHNKLVNLKGSLKRVYSNLNLSDNPLENFKGNLIYILGDLKINNLPFFKSLEQIKEALEDAGIVIGEEIITDFGIFRQSRIHE